MQTADIPVTACQRHQLGFIVKSVISNETDMRHCIYQCSNRYHMWAGQVHEHVT